MDGESGNLRLQLIAGRSAKTTLSRVLGSRELHLGQRSEGRAGSHLFDRRWGWYRHGSFQVPSEPGQTQSGAWTFGVRCAAPALRELRLRIAVWPTENLGSELV